MTDARDIEALIAGGESETCEWKKSTSQLPRAGETLCAFLNGSGGQVLIGIGPGGELLGQKVSDKTLRDVSRTLGRIQPHAEFRVEEVPLKGDLKTLVLHANPDPNQRPYLHDGRAYQRSGPTTAHMPHEVLYRQVLERPENENLWEGRAADGFTMEHIDEAAVQRAAQSGVSAGRLPSDIGNDTGDVLRGFDLLTTDGRLCNAALVLFAKPTPIGHRLFQCTLQLARFKGTDKTEFLDQLHAEGGAFHLLSDALMFIRRHMPVAARITPRQVEREETPLLPWDAVRETLINALIHRDYTDPGGSLQVAIYDDRMEIWNPGRLPAGVRLEQLKAAHKSIRRNRRIADAFFRTGHIEMWGRGTQTVVDLCNTAGRDEPVYAEHQRHFGVTFPAPFKATTSEVSLVADGLVVTPLQKQILALLEDTPAISLQQAVEKTGAARRTVQRALKELVKADLIVGEGASQRRVYRRA